MIKKIGIFAALMLAPTVAQAGAFDELCKVNGEAARLVMTMRQREVPMSTVLSTIDRVAFEPEERERQRAIVFNAYNSPSYQTTEMQQRAINEYVNDVIINCYETKSFRK